MILYPLLFPRQLVSRTPRFLFTSRRWSTSSALPASSQAQGSVQKSQQTSLTWVQLYDESPVSYGIDTWGGYLEMIPPKARLPYEKSANLENALDYIKHGTFTIRYRQSILEAPIELAKVELNGIRVAKKGIAKAKATMRINMDLIGSFKVQDIHTKSAASLVFDAGAAFRASKGHGIVTRDE